MKPSLAEIGNLLGGDSKAADRHMYGQIQSVITDASGKVTGYEVSLGGGSDTLRCRKIVGASVGDTVMVTRMANGIAVVTGTVGGDADALEALEKTEGLQDMIGDGSTTGIKVATEYCLHTSNQTAPGSGAVWSEDLPTYIAGRYYWKRTKTTYADNSAVYSTPILDGLSQLSAEADYLLDSVNNHFWFDNTGAYVSENDKSYVTGYATRIASSGIAQMYNGVVLNTLTGSGISYYAYDQNASGNRIRLVTYGASGVEFNDDIDFLIGNSSGSFIKWDAAQNKIIIHADSIEMGGRSVATDEYMEFSPTNGLRVYSGSKDSSTYNTSYTQIKTTGVELVSEGISLASFGRDVRIGQGDDYHTLVGNRSFALTDASNDIMFGVDSTGEIRSSKVVMFSAGADDKIESTAGAKTRTIYDDTGKVYDLDTTYTLYAAGVTTSYTPRTDGSEVTLTVPYKAGIGQPTHGYERTHTIKFTFSVDSTHAVLSKVEDTAPNYEYQWTSTRYSYTYPRVAIYGSQDFTVSTAIINGREYQLEDLFGTSSDVLSLGQYVCAAVLSSSSGYLLFSIPTGRVLPPGATVERITCNMVARAGYSEGTGRYIVKKTNGGTDYAPLDSDTSSEFYNAYNTRQIITPSMWSIALQGRTNVRVTIEGDRSYFFAGTEDISKGINNNPVVIAMTNIKLYLGNI